MQRPRCPIWKTLFRKNRTVQLTPSTARSTVHLTELKSIKIADTDSNLKNIRKKIGTMNDQLNEQTELDRRDRYLWIWRRNFEVRVFFYCRGRAGTATGYEMFNNLIYGGY